MKTPTKSNTVLTSSRNEDDFIRNLQSLGISVEEIVKELCIDSSQVTVLLTGSVAQGLATDASDIDVICLSTTPDNLSAGNADIVWAGGAGLADSTLKFYRHGAEFDIERYTPQSLELLVRSTTQLMDFMRNPQKGSTVPVLEPHELKFLHDLRNAWVLWNPQVHKNWVDRLYAAFLPVYCTVNAIMESYEYLEDAFSNVRNQSSEAVQIMARLAARQLCLALLAAHGETNPNEKWIIPLLRRTASQRPQMGKLSEEGISLLFPDGSHDSAGPMAYVNAVQAYGQKIERLISDDVKLQGVLVHLKSNVSYMMPA
jgi:hypothetical protein